MHKYTTTIEKNWSQSPGFSLRTDLKNLGHIKNGIKNSGMKFLIWVAEIWIQKGIKYIGFGDSQKNPGLARPVKKV
jgi:hypothetical protein